MTGGTDGTGPRWRRRGTGPGCSASSPAPSRRRGPGIELTITDPEGEVGPDVLLDALQELRDAGRRGGRDRQRRTGPAVRVVAQHVVRRRRRAGSGAGVEVDGHACCASPYRFGVIGDPRTLAAALDIPAAWWTSCDQRRRAGRGDPARRRSTITSLRAAPSPRYARPARRGRRRDGGYRRAERRSRDTPRTCSTPTEHEWVRQRGRRRVRVGITDYAQDALGDIVFVTLPEVGQPR